MAVGQKYQRYLLNTLEYLLDHADHHADAISGAECWKWTDWKWYDCDPKYYPEVDFIEKLMLELPEED